MCSIYWPVMYVCSASECLNMFLFKVVRLLICLFCFMSNSNHFKPRIRRINECDSLFLWRLCCHEWLQFLFFFLDFRAHLQSAYTNNTITNDFVCFNSCNRNLNRWWCFYLVRSLHIRLVINNNKWTSWFQLKFDRKSKRLESLNIWIENPILKFMFVYFSNVN